MPWGRPQADETEWGGMEGGKEREAHGAARRSSGSVEQEGRGSRAGGGTRTGKAPDCRAITLDGSEEGPQEEE